MDLFATLSINDTRHLRHSTEWRSVLSIIMLSAIMLSVIMLIAIMLSVIMLNVILLNVVMMSVFMLNVVAPLKCTRQCIQAYWNM